MAKRSFFWNLAKDTTANVIIISAAALVPLVAMVGGGVDASRYYMTTSRLQAACDAGALAARRAMDQDDFQSQHRTIANNFFDQNYEDGQFGIENLSRTYNGDADGKVTGTATGELPTSLMSIFGYDEFDVSVSCEADINISNTDIVFVLDNTGSMQCAPDESSCSINFGSNPSDSKLRDLQSAAKSFYDTVSAATSSSAQVRYGFVPYSSQVNVGNILYAADSSWMATSATYQSREANWENYSEWEPTGGATVSSVSFNNGYWYQYADYDWDTGYNSSSCAAQEPADIPEVVPSDISGGTLISTSGGDPRTATYQNSNALIEYWEGFTYYYGGSSGWCAIGYYIYDYRADVTYTVTEEEVFYNYFDDYTYKPVTFDLSTLYDDNSVGLPTGYQGANENHSWGGCIEEADTVATDNFEPIPAGAYDLDIDLVPSNDAERWKPWLPTAVYYRYTDGSYPWYGASYWRTADYDSTEDKYTVQDYYGNPACPRESQRLEEMTETEFDTYIDSLSAWGATYHDYGMIWGARFISPDGIFAAANTSAPNGDAISRHIVFMTDGVQSTAQTVYGFYGIEYWDRHITSDGSQSQMSDRHAKRFQAACEAARNKNISIWVVAFGTSLTQNLIDCATSGRAYQASDSDELDDAFTEIAEKIAALRLTA